MDLSWTTLKVNVTIASYNSLIFRRTIPNLTPISYEIHGFCDASQIAYGPCVYKVIHVQWRARPGKNAIQNTLYKASIVLWYLKIKSGIQVGILLVWKVYLSLHFSFIFSIWKWTDIILLTHYFCDFNCSLLLLNHTLLREVFFCQNLTFIRLTLKAVYILCTLW
jgi:hypothetical protein